MATVTTSNNNKQAITHKMEATLFTLTKTSTSGIRQGLLFNQLPTPNYLTFTRKGGVPIISPKHFGYLGLQLFHFSYADIASFQDILKPFRDYYLKKNPSTVPENLHILSQYTSMSSDSFSYLSFGDVVDAKIQGGIKDEALEIVSKKHKQTVTSHTFSQFVALANPHIFVTPSEVIEPSMGKKRRVRAAKQAIKYVERCINSRKELEFPQCKLVAPVILQSEELESCPEIKKLAELSEVDGYLYCGFSSMPTGEEKLGTIKGVHEILAANNKKVRIYQGDGNPVEVIFGILHGIDLFESWYPFKLAEGKCAMYLTWPAETELAKDPLNESQKQELTEMLAKKEIKYVDFNDKGEKGVLTPIQKDCECFTCKNHTRAYIDHLVECDEMNWLMLLAILNRHNMHVYEMFFRAIRKAVETDTFEQFAYLFLKNHCGDKAGK